MTSRFAKSDWDQYAKWYDDLSKLRPYADMMTDVAEQVGIDRIPVLDAGCGTGNLIHALKQRDVRDVVGVDASRAMLARAKQKCPYTIFVQSSLNTALPFNDGTFGTVVCVNTLYAIPDPSSTLREFRRVLRWNGCLVVITPRSGYENGLILKAHCGSQKPDSYWRDAHRSDEQERRLVHEAITDTTLAERFLWIARINRAIAREHSFRFFTATELADLASNNGFSDIRVEETYAGQNLLLVATRT